jgi:hypothetical protein
MHHLASRRSNTAASHHVEVRDRRAQAEFPVQILRSSDWYCAAFYPLSPSWRYASTIDTVILRRGVLRGTSYAEEE